MSLQHARPGGGPALARAVRVNPRLACVALLLFASTAIAQPVAEQPVTSSGAPAFVATRDTVLMKQVEAEGTWWDTVTSIASGLMTISILVLTAALVPAAWNFRKNHQMIRRMIEKFQGDVAPILQHASAIADDVNYISTSVRADVQQINQTVAAANRQLLDAVRKAEERVNEFNALITVAQEEAEDAFISTAAALRGISTGAAALAGVDPGRRRRGPRRARSRESDRDLRERMAELRAAIDEDLHSAVEDVGPALEDSFEEEESTDGNDDGRGTTDGGRAASRAGRQRPGDGRGSGEGGAV